MNKPFSQACINNQEPIRHSLEPYIRNGGLLLEIGSGTGQHGAYIANRHANLIWQPSDQPAYLEGIQAWVNDTAIENFRSPLPLNVNTASWTEEKVDWLYSANTVHIMSWEEVEKLFSFVPTALKGGGLFFLYGPFNYKGQFTSESNARFDQHLREQAPHRGIRDFEAINDLALKNNLKLIDDHAMPANNRLLVWQNHTN